MKRHSSIFPFLFLVSALPAAPLSPEWLANPPPADPVPEDCECRCGCCETVSDGCTMVEADLGASTPESGSVPLSLEIRFDAEAWDAFAMTNRVDGFGGVTETTSWTYYTEGGSKGVGYTESARKATLNRTPRVTNGMLVVSNKASKRHVKTYVLTVAEVEEATGLKFFSKLPVDEQKRLKSEIDLNEWSFK